MVAACRVCGALLDKERTHYGGISCYSCRQFFRRETNTEELKSCNWEKKCLVKECRACRYEKCLAIGMRTDLVLDMDGKKRRFSKFNKEEEESDNSIVEISDESSDDSFEIPLIAKTQEEDFTTNESILDPETGQLIDFTEASTGGLEWPERPLSYVTSREDISGLQSTSRWKERTNLQIQYRKNDIEHHEAPFLTYDHKKFRKTNKAFEDEKNPLLRDDSILGVALLPHTEDGTTLQVVVKKPTGTDNSTRQSVIANSQSYTQRGDQETEEIITFSFSIHEIENIYLQEEENHVENLTNLFKESWHGISIIGENFVSEMVGLFQGGEHQMSMEVLQLSRLQTRSVVYDWRFYNFS